MSDIDLTSPEVKQAIADAVAEEVKGLKAKNTELIDQVKKLRKNAEIDPADMAALETERDDLKAKLSEQTKLASKAVKDLEAANKRATDIDSAYSNTLKDAALSQALAKAGVTDPVYIEAAKALLGNGVQVVDADGKRVVKAGEVDLEKHITEWASSDAGKRFVSAPDTNGGGAGHGNRGTQTTGDKLPDVTDRAGRAATIAARLAKAEE
ncbi:hypothetical protein [Pseudoxanthomonas sp. PXM05]|uniref:hypothetical protein n=1 Tax=Pseudoxanthomonas sp. PXM05 TaxID=2854775 RepID=UPI001C43BAF7|nr:hypothetical protein [Pseudoxanthomonas sp. PXM05]MBV7475389.1 hypothetical protein [Pseudoxanthomonas sp. PXM05]